MLGTKIRNDVQLANPVDVLLKEFAIRIQLSPTDYNKAVRRYHTVSEWIGRDDSPLNGRVDLCYAHGSMAIGSTIASKLRTDEFDIDIALQLDLPVNMAPGTILDIVFTAIRGNPGSRYYDMAIRRTRCVTVNYSDDMHLDVTPMIRRWGTPDRESWIFHHHESASSDSGKRLVANPYGFAMWFKNKIPDDPDFAEAYQKRTIEYMEIVLAAKADSEPVPPPDSIFRKSKAVIALQLLKRWRNVQYDSRPTRRPPSIMISKLVADAANQTNGLGEELLFQARSMLSEFDRWRRCGRLIRVVNPFCPADVLTDRWPGSWTDQNVFVEDLYTLVGKLERLVSGCPLDEMQQIMVELFGETPTLEALRSFNKRQGSEIESGRSQHLAGTGRLVVAPIAVGTSVSGSPGVRRTPRHTFFGSNPHK